MAISTNYGDLKSLQEQLYQQHTHTRNFVYGQPIGATRIPYSSTVNPTNEIAQDKLLLLLEDI